MNPTLSPRYSASLLEAGCDEAGRGCLAGPVFAAAVILPEHFNGEGLTDSKKLSAAQRNLFRSRIEKQALAWAVAMVDNDTIDEINILAASIHAMHLAVEMLPVAPEYLLIDGNRFKPYQNLPYTCMVRGDSRFLNIAAASVLAKTHRDEYMKKLHEEYPEYGWARNKGYPTPEHRRAIARLGISRYHRRSFRCSEQMKLTF